MARIGIFKFQWMVGSPREEFMIHAYGVNGQDLLLTMQGLNPGEFTSLFIDSIFEIRE